MPFGPWMVKDQIEDALQLAANASLFGAAWKGNSFLLDIFTVTRNGTGHADTKPQHGLSWPRALRSQPLLDPESHFMSSSDRQAKVFDFLDT